MFMHSAASNTHNVSVKVPFLASDNICTQKTCLNPKSRHTLPIFYLHLHNPTMLASDGCRDIRTQILIGVPEEVP